MNEEALENAISVLARKITDKASPDEALKFSQAALNLAYVLSTYAGIANIEKSK